MKRFHLWIAVLLLAFALYGCQRKENPNVYDIAHNGKTYTVNQEQGTITCNGVAYQFEISGSGTDSVYLNIIYPDGSGYYWTDTGNLRYGGWSDDYNPNAKGYVKGEVLWDVLGIQAGSREDSGLSLLLAFLLLLAGAFQAVAPKKAWMQGYGWRFKNAEPSEQALTAHRALGAVMMFFGLIWLLVSIF